MSDAERKSEKLSALIDGELTSADTWDLEKAIETDPELAGELRALRATRDVLRKLPPERAPDDFANRVLERAERHHLMHYPSAEKALRASRWITAAAAAVVLIAAGFGGYMMMQSWPPPRAGTDIAFTPAAPEGGPTDRERSEDVLPGKGGIGDGSGGTLVAKTGEADRAGGRIIGKNGKVVSDKYLAEKAGTALAAKPIVGKGGGGSGAAALLTENLVFNTDNLSLAQRDVETVLGNNGLQPAMMELASGLDDAIAKGGLGKGVYTQTGKYGAPLRSASSRANVYQRNENERQIQFDIYVSPDQMEKVKGEVLAQLTGPRPAATGKVGAPDYLAKLESSAVNGGQVGVSNASVEQRMTMLDKATLKETGTAPDPVMPSKTDDAPAPKAPAPPAKPAPSAKAKTAKTSTPDGPGGNNVGQTMDNIREQVGGEPAPTQVPGRPSKKLTPAPDASSGTAKQEETPSAPAGRKPSEAEKAAAQAGNDVAAKAKPTTGPPAGTRDAADAKRRVDGDGGGLARQKDQPATQKKSSAESQPVDAASQGGAQSQAEQVAQRVVQQSRIGANLRRLVITLNLAPAVRASTVKADVRAKDAAAPEALKEKQQAPPVEK